MAKPADLLARATAASVRMRKDAGTVLRGTPPPEPVPRRTPATAPVPVAEPEPARQSPAPAPAETTPKRHTFDFSALTGRPSGRSPVPVEADPTVPRRTPGTPAPSYAQREEPDAASDGYFDSDPGPVPDPEPQPAQQLEPPLAPEAPAAQPTAHSKSFASSFLALVRSSSNKSFAPEQTNRPESSPAPAPRGKSLTHLERAEAITRGDMEEARARPIRRSGEDPPWDDPLRPAGSMFCAEQWSAARDGGRYNVFEMASASERQLIRLPKPMQSRLLQRVVDGRVTQVSEAQLSADQARRDTMLEYLGPALDGCILFGPGANPTHVAGLVESAIVLTDPLQMGPDFHYAVLEPRQRTSDDLILMQFSNGGRLTLSADFFAGLATPTLGDQQDAGDGEAPERPSQRG